MAIIREGRLVRVGSVAELKDIKRHEVTITFADAVPAEAFKALDGVEQVEALDERAHAARGRRGQPDAVIKAAAAVSRRHSDQP